TLLLLAGRCARNDRTPLWRQVCNLPCFGKLQSCRHRNERTGAVPSRAWTASRRLPMIPAGEPDPTSSADEAKITFVPERQAVLLAGREVALTPTQFRLLAALVGRPGHAWSREELVE